MSELVLLVKLVRIYSQHAYFSKLVTNKLSFNVLIEHIGLCSYTYLFPPSSHAQYSLEYNMT